jgi:hypothetical protein
MMALASLHFREGRRAAADALVTSMLARESLPLDPWWIYGPGDYRHVQTMLTALRSVLK